MPSLKTPCIRCRERHERCDNRQPRCGRCEKRDVECRRPEKRSVFKRGSRAHYDGNFSGDQFWFNSRAHTFRNTSVRVVNGSRPECKPPPDRAAHASASTSPVSLPNAPASERLEGDGPAGQDRATATPAEESHITPASAPLGQGAFFPSPLAQQVDTPPSTSGPDQSCSTGTGCPFEDVQEACLLRYFVEELAHWFDQCDEQRHFRLVVPKRARSCKPLLYAILASAARHLTRVPRYKTASGIVYHGQLLPCLTAHTAYEYMLRCIPALHEAPQTQDEERRENLAAAAVILRQFEEMDQDQEDTQDLTSSLGHEHVNFLDITKAILESAPPSHLLCPPSSLMSAIYWMALRQEIYYAFSLERTPQIAVTPEHERRASPANRLIVHTYHVAKWHCSDRATSEWERLKHQESILELESCSQFVPIVRRDADRSRGEIFPLIWYNSDSEITASQHFLLARIVLVAEDPSLSEFGASRQASREAEHQVRSMMLELCGLALHHLRSPPNLVTASLGIMLYGDYFTDPWERAALLRVLDKWKDQHAWPVKKAYDMLGADLQCRV